MFSILCFFQSYFWLSSQHKTSLSNNQESFPKHRILPWRNEITTYSNYHEAIWNKKQKGINWKNRHCVCTPKLQIIRTKFEKLVAKFFENSRKKKKTLPGQTGAEFISEEWQSGVFDDGSDLELLQIWNNSRNSRA